MVMLSPTNDGTAKVIRHVLPDGPWARVKQANPVLDDQGDRSIETITLCAAKFFVGTNSTATALTSKSITPSSHSLPFQTSIGQSDDQ